MKNHYTLVKMFLALMLAANSIVSTAQHTLEYLNANNVNSGFGIGGNLFSRIDSAATDLTWQLLEVPKGSGMLPMYTSSIWMSGYDAGSNLHCAAQRYAQTGHDFYDGPIATTYNTAYDKFYRRVFKITRAQILHHQSLGLNIPPSTTLDSAILFWPAKGNPYVAVSYAVNIDSRLAPFVDVDGDGWYDPYHGDYPDICGEEAIFFVFNDLRGPHLETGGTSLGVEVRGLAEVFVDNASTGLYEKRALNNTVFVKYEVENKTAINLFNFNLSMFEDIDLGCYMNDRVGCDTNRNLMFVYNGSAADPDCQGEKGYGLYKVASGTTLLSGGLSAFGYFTNGASAAQTDPQACAQYRNYEQGLWNDGTPFTQGGPGYGGTIPTKFVFPGDPNNPNDWSEISVSNTLPSGDRRMYGGINSGTLSAGATLLYDFAFTTSYDTSATNLTIIDTLKHDADIVQSFYNNSILSCRSSHQIPLAIKTLANQTLEVRVHPNPASSLLTIESGTTVDLVELTDVLGRTVLTKTANAEKLTVDVSALAHGMYLLRVKAGNKTAVKKIVVE